MALRPQDSKTPAVSATGWKTQTYMFGIIGGLIFGVLAAYLFARAAEENAVQNGGKPESISTGQLISLGLAALALVRQISEMGKPSTKNKK